MTSVSLRKPGTLFQGNFYTNDATLDFDAVAAGDTRDIKIFRDGVQIFPAGTATLESVFLDVDGKVIQGTYSVRVTDTPTGGPVGATFFLGFILDTTAPGAPTTIGLANDSGINNADLITNDATLDISGLEDGVTIRYGIQPSGGGILRWFATQADLNAALASDEDLAAAAGDTDGIVVTVIIEQTDRAGNVTESSTTFTLDQTDPTLDVTVNGTAIDATAETGATLSYRYALLDPSNPAAPLVYSTASATPPIDLAPGAYKIEVTATDVAGNDTVRVEDVVVPEPEATLPTPVIALQENTGDPADTFTRNGAIAIPTLLAGQSAEFSYDGGNTWENAQRTLIDGAYAIQVRIVDTDGGFSPAATVNFTLDTVIGDLSAPATLDVDIWTALSDFVTTFEGQEAGAVLWYKVNDGTFTTDRPVSGLEDGDIITVYQIDLAGNQSAEVSLTITDDEPPNVTPQPSPLVAFDKTDYGGLM